MLAENMPEYSPSSHPVKEMFGSIAKRYDLTNTALSLGLHHAWKRKLIAMTKGGAHLKVLDLCTGTGDLLPLLERKFGTVVGADFCVPMLKVAGERFNSRGQRFELREADAMSLPFDDRSFDAVTVSFGVRNFKELERGLLEIRRVLKPGGELLILEFGQPQGWFFGSLFKFYSKYIMPIVGGVLTGNKEAYEYLPETSKAFPCNSSFAKILSAQGFKNAMIKPCTFGIAYAYKAEK